MKFLPKPVAIEAYRNPKSEPTGNEILPEWFFDAVNDRRVVHFADGSLGVETVQGDVNAQPGDYVLCDANGQLTVMAAKQFKAQYTRATKRMLEVA